MVFVVCVRCEVFAVFCRVVIANNMLILFYVILIILKLCLANMFILF